MFNYNTSDNFVKIENFLISKDEISLIDISKIENLEVSVTLKNGTVLETKDILALELIMQIKPSAFEGKRLKWPKFVWIIHNLIGHPLTQIFALFKMYKLAFWIHDATVPKPLGKKY
jgi:hypothetical protein